MRYLQCKIAGIPGAIVFLAVGFAALRESDDLWDSGLFSLTLGLLLAAVLLAVHRSSRPAIVPVGSPGEASHTHHPSARTLAER